MRLLPPILLAGLLSFVPLTLAAQAQPAPSNDDCLACHSDDTLTKDVDGTAVSVHVDPQKFGASIHGSMLSCTDCHTDVGDYPHEAPAKVTCDGCHPDAVTAHEQSFHGKALAKGNGRAAACASCHGDIHEVLPSSDPASKTTHANIPDTCGSCHGQKLVMEPSGFTVEPFLNYKSSVHGRALEAGKGNAAVCTDCHDYHNIQSGREQTSPINRFNIPETCGKCHGQQTSEFVSSIHGMALERGNGRSPSCTDCHGIHDIKAHTDPTSSISFTSVARSTCAQCHEGVRLSREFGVAGGRVSSYRDSYHGLLTRFGSKTAANCASCHGVHNILPSSNPQSLIHPDNLAQTCGSCHPGATDSFARTKVHLEASAGPPSDFGGAVIYWVRTFYIWLIVIVIGGMFLHNLALWVRKARNARKDAGRVIVRMRRTERMQHLVNLLAFFALVISGFALAFPDSWLSTLLGSNEFARRWIHRVAAIVMMAVGLWHLAYMFGTAHGRKGLADFFPRWRDVHEFRQMVAWIFGRTTHRPNFARFGYAEKAEYWALLWGTLVMSVTGLALWAKVWVATMVPGWWIDVALAIHYYEAILATLAIVVWHFYHVIFDPDVAPMNFAWIDGKVSTEFMEHEHPEEYQRWLAERREGRGED